MNTSRKDWWKVAVIVVVSGFIDMALHALLSPLSSSNSALLKPSILVRNFGVVPTVIAWEILAFGVLALIFIVIQSNLPGKKWIKGFLYGLSFAGLYLIGMFESVLLFNSTLLNEFLMGLGDFIPILLMGILMGIFAGTDETIPRIKPNIWSVLIMAAFYITGRYFGYSVLNIESAYMVQPLGTFIWTLSQGLWVGVIYLILQSGVKGKSPIAQALFFALLVFGANWLANHLFIAAMFQITSDLFVRVGTDILFVIIGAYVCKKWRV